MPSNHRLASLAAVCGVLVSILGATTQVSWLSGNLFAASFGPSYIPMAPSTAFCFLGLGAALCWLAWDEAGSSPRRFARVVGACVLIVGLVILLQFALDGTAGLHFDVESVLVRSGRKFGSVAAGRMAPLTATQFILLGASLVSVTWARGRAAAGVLGSIVTAAASVVSLGYLYGTPLSYGGNVIPMAAPTALGFVFTAVGLIALAGPGHFPLDRLLGPSVRSRLLRAFLPVVVGGVLAFGLSFRLVGVAPASNVSLLFSSLLTATVLGAIVTLIVRTVGTEIERAEADTRKKSEELEQFFSLSVDLFCIAGFNGYFKVFNPAWERLLGWSSDELKAKPYLDFVHPDDRASTVAEASKLSKGATTVSFDNRYLCKDGSYKWLEWTSAPSQREELIYAVAHDQTERKRLDVAKSEFIALASHQLRTPITAIRWTLELLEEEAHRLPPDQAKLVRDAYDASVRMAEIVQTMLRVSHIDSRNIRLVLSTVPVRSLLEQIQADFASVIAHKNQTFSLSCPDHLSLQTDPHLLTEILSNLVSNAIKYTPAGGSIRAEGAEDGHGVTIRVSDTGVGIPASEQQHVCSKLFRASNAIALDPMGTGLGLYVASSLVKLLGSRLSFVSHVLKGSTFTLTLPHSPHG